MTLLPKTVMLNPLLSDLEMSMRLSYIANRQLCSSLSPLTVFLSFLDLPNERLGMKPMGNIEYVFFLVSKFSHEICIITGDTVRFPSFKSV